MPTLAISRRGLLLGSLLASTGLATIGTAMAQKATPTPMHGGILTFVLMAEPTVGLINIVSAGATRTTAKTNEGLLTYDFDLTPRPQLATEWDIAEDGMTYTFKLRPNVKWHDGKPFTSEDVKVSYTLLRKGHPRSQAVVLNIAEIETPDPLTVIFRMSAPAPYLIYGLAAAEMPIVPAHIFKIGEDASQNPAIRKPIGTGPFKFKEWVRGSHIIYERNPDYWDAPKPYVDGIVFRVMTDQAARSAAFETGEILIGDETPVSYADIKRLTQTPALDVTADGYTSRNTVARLVFNLDHPIFSNLKVRQAIELAIDKQRLVDSAWFGYGKVGTSAIPSGIARFHVPVETKAVDLIKANALMDEAGYPKGADGSRFKVNIDYYPGFSPMKSQAEFIKSELAKIGIIVNVRNADYATYVKRIYTDRDFEFYTTTNSATFDPTIGVQRNYLSTAFTRGVPFSNGSHYVSKIADDALNAAAREPDEKKRYEYFDVFQRQVAQDLPAIALIEIQQLTVFNKRVHNHTLAAEGLWSNMADLFLTKT
ncbi:ABC transporter substrate-binding protein [Chelatococcus asaccharovorans]|uniref:Peptide/nickel transport system substrate-binding protein n=1 Tax=Chelatococcus asaccharovorans TaxID=28210 RepID=A0A2V3TVL3_9HYPH|nr:ABC transporter substrate-binding protein [Chelatococcus asaccharovorans]MBS7706146.1 ABC transporter substrate-binding protein [Chelatococcus asaccharovorans]PXW52520.1 peptide/nickel transport system substrate-binding protein [Chelatococcus asaccharovorans]